MHIGSTFENDTKELDPIKAYKYLGIEESFDIQHKNKRDDDSYYYYYYYYLSNFSLLSFGWEIFTYAGM